jgi:hypothetical protein
LLTRTTATHVRDLTHGDNRMRELRGADAAIPAIAAGAIESSAS